MQPSLPEGSVQSEQRRGKKCGGEAADQGQEWAEQGGACIKCRS